MEWFCIDPLKCHVLLLMHAMKVNYFPLFLFFSSIGPVSFQQECRIRKPFSLTFRFLICFLILKGMCDGPFLINPIFLFLCYCGFRWTILYRPALLLCVCDAVFMGVESIRDSMPHPSERPQSKGLFCQQISIR